MTRTPYYERLPEPTHRPQRRQPEPQRRGRREEDYLYEDAERLAPIASQRPQENFRFPDYLERGYSRPPARPPRPTPATQRTAERIQQRREDIQAYHEEKPEEAERKPAPGRKRRKVRFGTVTLALFLIMSLSGIGLAGVNFWYARGAENLATSVSFLHAEVVLLFVAMVFMFISLDVRGS